MERFSSETTGALLALSNDLANAVERVSRAVVAINARQRIPSSGVYWRPGVVVTAAHTIRGNEEITMTLPDGRTAPARLAGLDPSTDLAVLKVEAVPLEVPDIGDASLLKVGHLVLAVGRSGERGPSASLGVVSAVSGAWRTWRGGQIDQFIRLDLTLYPGFSGGPLVHGQRQVVGINTSGLSRSAPVSIPSSTVNRVTDTLLERGHIARGYLGVGLYPVRLPDALKNALKLPSQGGVVVLSVEPNGPADKAGLLIGDVLIGLDDTPVNDTDDVQAVLGPERVGKTVRASIVRGGTPAELTITVGERS